MQHSLLGLGLALIAAIVAALAAPLFVDWNAWRPEFEQRASALVGTPVSIRGPIEASILPTPAFVMRDVTVGDAEHGTGLKAGQIRGILSLGALFRGAVEAEEIVLTKPLMRLALGADGRVIVKETGGTNNSFSVSRFTIDGGTLVIDDRVNAKRFQVNDVAATGELQSRSGPLKLETSFAEDGKPRNNIWKLRASTGQFAGGKGKLRFSLTRADGLAFDADGSLALAGAPPRFEGKINLARQGALPWKLAANATASDLSLALDDLEVSFGSGETSAEFTGQARIEPLKRGLIDAELSAKFIDLDRASGTKNPNIAAALAPLRETLAGFKGQPLSGKLKLSVAQLVAGGGNIRELVGLFSLHDGAIAPERFEARLPGRGAINVKGKPSRAGDFKGQWTVSAEEPSALAEWTGLLPPDAVGGGAFKLEGGVSLAGGKMTLDPFLVSLGETKLGGSLVYEPGAANRPGSLHTKLNGNSVDVALLAPMLQKTLGRASPFDVNVSLDVRAPRILSQTARRLNVALSRKADALILDRLSIEDIGGLNLAAHGEITSYPERPKGRIEFTADANNPAGLNEFAGAFIGPEMAAYARRISATAMPLKLAGTITGDGKNRAFLVEAKGKAGDTEISLVSHADPQALSIGDTRLALTAPDASGLVALLGLPMPEAQAGLGKFEMTIGNKEKNAAPIKAHLVFPGIDLSADGALRFNGEGRVEPRINLKLEATDFRALSIAAARTSTAVVPANGTARLTRADGGIALEDISLDFGETRVRGRVVLKGVEQPALSGELSVNRSELATLLTLALGRAGEGAPWSDQPLGPAPLNGASGDFFIESAALGISGNLAATGVRTKFRFDRDQVSIEDFSGDLAGGKLKGHARISHPDLISFDGGFSLEDVDIARVISPANWRSIVHGKGNFSLDLAGRGASPAQLAANIAGRGKFALNQLEIEKLAPAALAKVVAGTAKGPLPDEASVKALLEKAMEQEPLKLAKIEGTIVAAGGVARINRLVAKSGGAEIFSDAALDLAKFNLDASIGFENPAPKGMNIKPAATVAWRGPLENPVRRLEVAPLMAVISLRAMEHEMQKIRDRANAASPRIPMLATEAPGPAPKARVLAPRPKPQLAPAAIGRPLQINPSQ